MHQPFLTHRSINIQLARMRQQQTMRNQVSKLVFHLFFKSVGAAPLLLPRPVWRDITYVSSLYSSESFAKYQHSSRIISKRAA